MRTSISHWVVASVSLLSVIAVVACATSGGLSDEESERLKRILEQVNRRFSHVCREIVPVVQTVRTKMQQGNVKIDPETLQSQLQKQCRIFEKLDAIKSEVCNEFGLQPAMLEDLLLRAEDDAEVLSLNDGLQSMIDDACKGRLPILPNLKVPPELTEKKILEMHKELQEAEIKKVGAKAWVGATQKDLEQLILAATDEARQEVFAKHGFDSLAVEVYHSVEELYTRGKQSKFAEKKAKIDVGYHERMLREIKKRIDAQR